MKQEEERLLDEEYDAAHHFMKTNNGGRLCTWRNAYFVTIHILLLCCLGVIIPLATRNLRIRQYDSIC